MENGGIIVVEPDEIRRYYIEEMEKRTENLRESSELRKVRFDQINTKNFYIGAIESYLGYKNGVRR